MNVGDIFYSRTLPDGSVVNLDNWDGRWIVLYPNKSQQMVCAPYRELLKETYTDEWDVICGAYTISMRNATAFPKNITYNIVHNNAIAAQEGFLFMEKVLA